MPLIEIIRNSLYQSPADPGAFTTLRELRLLPALVIDLHGIPLERIASDESIAYVRWPIPDGPIPDKRVLFTLEIMAAGFIDRGGCVITMCSMGQNRSGLLSAMVVAHVQHITGAEALRFVQSKAPGSLINPVFVHFLQQEGWGG